jgi:hypothetical protein
MIDILTNPVTLLCLGVMFLLIAALFFYFRRNISVLERAQMEQARILQSFITNMEMSQMAQQRHPVGGGYVNTENRENAENVTNTDTNFVNHSTLNDLTEPKLIDVSDENDSGESESDSEDSDSEDSDSDSEISSEECDNDNDNDNDNGANIIDIMLNATSIPIDMLDHIDSSINTSLSTDPLYTSEIKVVQLQDNEHLDELNTDSFNIESLDNSSSDSDDEDEDDDEDINTVGVNNDDSDNNNNIHQLPNIIEINKEPDTTADVNLELDFKSLNVQALRQIAEDKQLITKGEKKAKKELLAMLEQCNSSSNKE